MNANMEGRSVSLPVLRRNDGVVDVAGRVPPLSVTELDVGDKGPLPVFLRGQHAFVIRQAMIDLSEVVDDTPGSMPISALVGLLLSRGGAIKSTDDARQLLVWYGPAQPVRSPVAVGVETLRLRRAELNAGVPEAHDPAEMAQSSRPSWWSSLGKRSKLALTKRSVSLLGRVQEGMPMREAVNLLFESGSELDCVDQAKHLLAWQQRRALGDSPVQVLSGQSNELVWFGSMPAGPSRLLERSRV
jgi:hypothetical protein